MDNMDKNPQEIVRTMGSRRSPAPEKTDSRFLHF